MSPPSRPPLAQPSFKPVPRTSASSMLNEQPLKRSSLCSVLLQSPRHSLSTRGQIDSPNHKKASSPPIPRRKTPEDNVNNYIGVIF